MKKIVLKSALLAVVSVGLMAGSAMATSLSYWNITSSEANLGLWDTDQKLEFGAYSIADWQNPDGNTVDLTTLFNAGDNFGSAVQMNKDDWDTFGFYVKNVNNNRIWLSDSTISGTFTSGDLNGLTVRGDTDRFQINPVYNNNGDLLENDWDFSFTRVDGTTQRWMSRGNDLAPVPEPATMLLFGTGLAGLAGFSRKKSKKA